ncbi:hypothetical protein SS50377_24347 [Spironucleus salmonicida]|uniref:Uncharacterized protein n=1 Tax=Spironucleus salmonicida TaxID=348837 RepID=V6LQX2_9EUKA|nr:hypothetical protein SS50377_24347 [Spironucleus salmonicida]|eukprot:EST46101.1 Hypothetical protein SS50377_14095 [Spironucleus salmonicida]
MSNKYTNLEFNTKQHRDAFSTAFNSESKFIENQFRMESIPIFSFDRTKFLPPKIGINEKYIPKPKSKPETATDFQQKDGKFIRSFSPIKNQRASTPNFMKKNINLIYQQIDNARTNSPIQIQSYSPLKQIKLKRYISVPSAIYAIPRSESSICVRSYQNLSFQQQ